MPMPKKIRLGDLLVEEGALTQAQLEQALNEQKKLGLKLGKTITELGFLKEMELLKILAKQLKIPFIDLKPFKFKEKLVKKLPETLARRFRAIVLSENQNGLVVGMSDPLDIFAYDEIEKTLQEPFEQAVVSEAELLASLDVVYRRTDEILTLAHELGGELVEDGFNFTGQNDSENNEAPVVKLIQSLFEDALQVKASDIHIEPDEKVLRIRQRIDGVLQEQIMNYQCPGAEIEIDGGP